MKKSVTKGSGCVEVAGDRQYVVRLAGVLSDARQAFAGLCLNVGQQVFQQMMEDDRTALCGVKGVPDARRRAVRHGSVASRIVLGGQTLEMRRPRARSVERNEELSLPSFVWASGRDPLDQATLGAIAAGVSTRRYEGLQDDIGEIGHSKSKSCVSRRFVALSSRQLDQWLRRSLAELDLPVVMIDGIHFGERVIVIALGIDRHGVKHVLGLHEGATENTAVVRALLADLVERGLATTTMRLWVIDGAKSLRRAILDHFGDTALIQRCQEHKRRNVLDHLPKEAQASVSKALRDAWSSPDADLGKRQLERLANRLERQHPGAAESLREGLSDTLTCQRLGLSGALYLTLRSTNPIENLNGLIATYTRNVKRWRDGRMTLRWVASALSQAVGAFRKLKGFRDIPRLLDALEQQRKPATPSMPTKHRLAA